MNIKIINKRFPHSIISNILEYYNPYKEHYKNQVIYQLERRTLGAWYVYDLRDTIRNYMEHDNITHNYKTYLNGVMYGSNTGPHPNSSVWREYNFIQGNNVK